MEREEPQVENRDQTNGVRRDEALPGPPDPEAMMEAALDWVEQNQTLAILGAFAFGVFIGVMMRE